MTCGECRYYECTDSILEIRRGGICKRSGAGVYEKDDACFRIPNDNDPRQLEWRRADEHTDKRD